MAEDLLYTTIPAEISKGGKGKGKAKRWRWTDDMADALINCLAEIKAEKAFQGKDFESDLVMLYKQVREKMALDFNCENFGPVALTEPLENIEDMDDQLKETFKNQIASEKKEMKLGYERIKEKIKDIRQEYRKAVSPSGGRRSGSGRLICENWDILKTLWGGSPAVVHLDNSICSLTSGDDVEDSEVDEELNECDGETSNKRKLEGTAKYVDNKRKHMEKNLSASQRDQLFLKIAMDDVRLKENMLTNLKTATEDTNKAMEKIAESITSVGKSIGDGLALLAAALNPQPLSNNFYPPNNANVVYAAPSLYQHEHGDSSNQIQNYFPQQ